MVGTACALTRARRLEAAVARVAPAGSEVRRVAVALPDILAPDCKSQHKNEKRAPNV